MSTHPKYSEDPEINSLSQRLRTIQLLMNQPSGCPYPPGIRREDLCNERQRIMKKIHKRQCYLHSKRLDTIASKLEHCKKQYSKLQFELARQLLNNKQSPFQLRDEVTNKPILTPTNQMNAIKDYYSSFFNQTNYDQVVYKPST